jgi:hypothetical protein
LDVIGSLPSEIVDVYAASTKSPTDENLFEAAVNNDVALPGGGQFHQRKTRDQNSDPGRS